MAEAVLWGFVTSSSLLAGAILAIVAHPSRRMIGWVMAFGAGALISAVSYELVLDVYLNQELAVGAAGLALGAIVYYAGDRILHTHTGPNRTGLAAESDAPMAIALGAALDGIPESFIIGTAFASGEDLGAAFLVAVLVSNLPEAIAATSGLVRSGWTRYSVFRMWGAVVVCSTTAAGAGYLAVDVLGSTGVFAQSFAAGALLTMLSDEMIPEAAKNGGPSVGLITTLGFATAFAISATS